MSSQSPAQFRYAWLLQRYARPRAAGWAAILLVTLLAVGVGLLQPWPAQFLVDHVLGSKPYPAGAAWAISWIPGGRTTTGLIAWVAAAGLIAFAAHSVLEVVLTWLWIRVGQAMVYNAATDTFARVQRRSLAFHTRNSVGDLMARVTGDSWVVHTVADTLLFAPLHALVTIVIVLVIMFQINMPLTWLALALAPVMALAPLPLGRMIRSTSRAKRELESFMQSHVQQTLAGIMVVQAFAQEHREQERFRRLGSALIGAIRRNTLASSFLQLTTGLVNTVGTGLVLWFGARQVMDGALTLGTLLVFLAYLGTLQGQFKVFTGIYGALQGARVGADRLMEMLGPPPEVSDRPGAVALPSPARGHVRVENVTFGYEPNRPVLHGVSLEARPGETVAIVGPTGAGKSTLVGLVPRFFDAWNGRVTVDGHDVRDVTLQSLRSQVAIVLQEPFLFPLTIAENIAYGRPEATRAEVEAAARAANANGFIERLSEGYDTVIGERGATLSGGERQRLSIARALLKDAPILILDEPTSALDAETEQMILEALRRLMKGRTTLVIAHRLSTIRDADRIVVLQNGAVVEVGRHQELVTAGVLYSRLHASQCGSRERGNVAASGEAGAGESS